MSVWGTVGSWASAGIGYAGNFVGSVIRNTLVVASNILPDAGVFGSLGDNIGNALSAGSPFSGGGSGGSVLNLFSSDRTTWSPVANLDWASGRTTAGVAPAVDLSGTETSLAPDVGGAAPAVGETAAPAAPTVEPAKPSATPGQISAAALVATPQPKPLSSFAGHERGSDGRISAVTTRAAELRQSGFSLLGENASENSVAAFQDGMVQLGEAQKSYEKAVELGDPTLRNSAIDGMESAIAAIERASGKVDPATATLAATWNQTGKTINTELLDAGPLAGDKVRNLPEVRRYNSKVNRVEQTRQYLEPRVADAVKNGTVTPDLVLEVQAFNQMVTGLESDRVALGSMTYRDGWTRKNILTGEDAGVDLDHLATWAQILTPVALAGLQYYAQGKADKKNAKYLSSEKEKDRQFEREMSRERLDAQLQIAGIEAEASAAARAPVGASQAHTFSAGTYGA